MDDKLFYQKKLKQDDLAPVFYLLILRTLRPDSALPNFCILLFSIIVPADHNLGSKEKGLDRKGVDH